jgi:arylsulfatase A-like enzyme
MAPHDPRTTPKAYRDLYQDDSITIPGNFMGVHPFDNGEMDVRDEHLEAWPRTPAAIRRHLADYYAMITHLDDRIGDIVDTVARQGKLNRTIFILAGDNGLAIGSHGLMGKQNLYDHSIHVPLLWAGPGIVPGHISHSRCYLFDIFPTVCDLLGIETPSTVDGISMAKQLTDSSLGVAGGRGPHATMCFAYKNLQRCIMDDTRKLIKYTVPQPCGDGTTIRYQLFDRQSDPSELRDISSEPQEQAHLERLGKHLEEWIATLEPLSTKYTAT